MCRFDVPQNEKNIAATGARFQSVLEQKKLSPSISHDGIHGTGIVTYIYH